MDICVLCGQKDGIILVGMEEITGFNILRNINYT
jgi:hypothetical protein